MSLLEELEADCPYCGEHFAVEAEPASAGQQFIEDCPVCCAPIELVADLDAGGRWQLSVRRDDD
ncbi:MAG: CPXCG motif-containing cysteine-rich protein [Proteobacteria bacterium]|nr:CPXCG motif-containing cysteine-rich protein [Pseudomonadota bacterium]